MLWDNEVCGYCDHEHSTRAHNTRYTCPKCARSGCPKCMPEGESAPCPSCKEEQVQDNAIGLKV